MKKKLIPGLLFVFSLAFLPALSGQQDPNTVIATISNEPITTGEFLSSFKKNNQLSKTTPEELREYLDLYINFRLKVKEGLALKIDTSRAFQRELNTYQQQSAQQYLIDKDISDKLMDEALERTKNYVRASHILINCSPTASPKDTLTAYNKAMEVREKIMNGLDFNEAAVLYSQDMSAREYINPRNNMLQQGNKGDLGYFTVFNMIYPVETAVYNTPVGSVSMPVRSEFGYHLVKVTDKIPAIETIEISHIFIRDSMARNEKMSNETRAKLNDIESKLKAGSSFEDMVKIYSDDTYTKEKDGVVDPFAPNRRAGNYVKTAISLKPGEISAPFALSTGWYIIKLNKINYLEYDQDEASYYTRTRLGRDPRSHLSKQSLVNKLKKEYSFNESGKEAGIKYLQKNLPETTFQSSSADFENLPGIDKQKPLFSFADRQVTVKEFTRYLSRFKGVNMARGYHHFLLERYDAFVEETIIAYEKDHLESKYPEYRELMDEYHQGMVLYEINSQNVWGKAMQDSVGLTDFYESIKTNYPVEGSDPVEYKALGDIRSTVITQYQDYLDKEWIRQLRAKYPVQINEQAFNAIFKK